MPTVEDGWPCFSPNGDSIAFVHWGDRGDSLRPTGLYVVGANGGKPRLVLRGNFIGPDWSPDGRLIAFVLAYGSPLYVVSPTGDSLRRITSFTGFSPSWSPDGRELLFATNHLDASGARVLWIVPFDGSPPRDISQHGTGEWLDGHWSPSGQQIAHCRYLTGVHDSELFIMDRDGSGGQRLTYNDARDGDPAWSPGDSLIAWTQDMGIRVMRPDGTGERTLSDGSDPAWSPDGRTIVFARIIQLGRSWNRHLFTMRVDGSGVRQITFE